LWRLRKKLPLRLLQREAARKTLQNPLAGSLLAHRQRPDPPLVPPTGPPTPDAPQQQRGRYPLGSWPVGSRWPLLVLEEAQNFSASSLEEIGLLTCARTDTRPTLPFSLLMIGDDSLLPRLQMGINHWWGSAASTARSGCWDSATRRRERMSEIRFTPSSEPTPGCVITRQWKTQADFTYWDFSRNGTG
jgi:hypothetical protein